MLTNPLMKKQHGLTLIELMISIALGLLVLTALVFLLASTMRTNTQTLRSTHLNQELRSIMQLMSKDLKRSGYAAGAENISLCSSASSIELGGTSGTVSFVLDAGNKACDNFPIAVGYLLMNITNVGGVVTTSCASFATVSPFTVTNTACPGAGSAVNFTATTLPAGEWTIVNPFTSITAQDVASDADANDDCVLFTYDADDDGLINAATERYGFRLNAVDGTIETGTAVTSCTAGTWESLNDDSNVEITNFDIEAISTTNAAATVNVCVREINLLIDGRLRTDNSVTRKVQEVVKVRNDQIIESSCPSI